MLAFDLVIVADVVVVDIKVVIGLALSIGSVVVILVANDITFFL